MGEDVRLHGCRQLRRDQLTKDPQIRKRRDGSRGLLWWSDCGQHRELADLLSAVNRQRAAEQRLLLRASLHSGDGLAVVVGTVSLGGYAASGSGSPKHRAPGGRADRVAFRALRGACPSASQSRPTARAAGLGRQTGYAQLPRRCQRPPGTQGDAHRAREGGKRESETTPLSA